MSKDGDTPTPETDAKAFDTDGRTWNEIGADKPYVYADFARTLERDRDRLRDELGKAERQLATASEGLPVIPEFYFQMGSGMVAEFGKTGETKGRWVEAEKYMLLFTSAAANIAALANSVPELVALVKAARTIKYALEKGFSVRECFNELDKSLSALESHEAWKR